MFELIWTRKCSFRSRNCTSLWVFVFTKKQKSWPMNPRWGTKLSRKREDAEQQRHEDMDWAEGRWNLSFLHCAQVRLWPEFTVRESCTHVLHCLKIENIARFDQLRSFVNLHQLANENAWPKRSHDDLFNLLFSLRIHTLHLECIPSALFLC